jgi:pimeloyl-ACP methyl ester carboxylesterase
MPADAPEAVVFVHGNPGPAEDWRRLVARTGAFARAVAPDLPGYGGVDKPDRFDYTVDGYARHLGSILDQLDVHRVHLVLHDFGGPWGLTWAADHPDRFASVTLVNTGCCAATAGTTSPVSGARRCSVRPSCGWAPCRRSGCSCATATPAGCPAT